MRSPKTRGRKINVDISDSKGFASLSPEAAVLFTMLIPHYNPYGKLNGDPGYLKGEVCPRISYLTLKNLSDLLLEISDHTSVKWFEHDGRYWIHSIKFNEEHQDINLERVGPDLLPNYSGVTPTKCTPKSKSKSKSKCGGQTPESSPPPMTDEEYIQHVKDHFNTMIENPGQTAEWKRFYNGSMNVDDILFAASTWLIEHPDKRRTRLKQFYGTWLRNQFQRISASKAVNP